MVVSRISDQNKNENQEKLAVIRDPFYNHADPVIPDGSTHVSGGFRIHAAFEILIPSSLADDIDIMVMPSWTVPVCYRKAGTPWVSASGQYENVICPKISGGQDNQFMVTLPTTVGPPLTNMTIRPDSIYAMVGPKYKKWRHVSSAITISDVQSNNDPQSVVLVRNNPVKMDMSAYSLLSPVYSPDTGYPNGLQAFSPNTSSNVVIAPDFDPYQQLSDIGNYGFFKNMKGVWCGSLREAGKYRFQLRPNDTFFDRADAWNTVHPRLGVAGYIDTSRIGCPLGPSPYNNDRQVLESSYDFRFDGLQIRLWNPPTARTQPIRVRVEYQGNFEGVLSKSNVTDSLKYYIPGNNQERHNLLSAYLDIYRDQQRNRVPGVLL